MTDLDALLERPELSPRLRLLVLLKIAAREGDQDRIAELIAHARSRGVARADLEETLLQGVLFHGFPRTVTAFGTLTEHWPVEHAPESSAPPESSWPSAGRELFDAIYDRNAPAVHSMLAGFHPDLHDFVIESAYGRVLCRPGLSPRERELLAVGSLAAMAQIPQMIAHARGARQFGASREAVQEAMFTALGDDTVVAEHMSRVR